MKMTMQRCMKPEGIIYQNLLLRIITLSSMERTFMFWEEIIVCVRVHIRYVMDAWDHVQFLFLLTCMLGNSFMLNALTSQ